jgi:hypothetical protein
VSQTSDAALFEAYETADVNEVKKLARMHTRDAINVLVKLMKAPKTPAGVKRACASDILTQGWGRPDARGDTAADKGGITINIMKLSTGVVEQITTGNEDRMVISEAVSVAKTIELGPGPKDE